MITTNINVNKLYVCKTIYVVTEINLRHLINNTYNMRFGKCLDCNEYKYLVNGNKCNSCENKSTGNNDDNNWVVVKRGYRSGGSTEVHKKGLSEAEAKKIARTKTIFSARKLDDIDGSILV